MAAAGEFYCRSRNATNFAFDTMVGAGPKSNAVAPTAGNMQMQAGEMVLLGIAPRFNGYAGVMGDTLPISGEYTQAQKDVLNVIREVFRKTRDALKPGECGKTLDPIGAKIFAKHDWTRYIVCPFVHGLGLMEAERPFLEAERHGCAAAGFDRLDRHQLLRPSGPSWRAHRDRLSHH